MMQDILLMIERSGSGAVPGFFPGDDAATMAIQPALAAKGWVVLKVTKTTQAGPNGGWFYWLRGRAPVGASAADLYPILQNSFPLRSTSGWGAPPGWNPDGYMSDEAEYDNDGQAAQQAAALAAQQAAAQQAAAQQAAAQQAAAQQAAAQQAAQQQAAALAAQQAAAQAAATTPQLLVCGPGQQHRWTDGGGQACDYTGSPTIQAAAQPAAVDVVATGGPVSVDLSPPVPLVATVTPTGATTIGHVPGPDTIQTTAAPTATSTNNVPAANVPAANTPAAASPPFDGLTDLLPASIADALPETIFGFPAVPVLLIGVGVAAFMFLGGGKR